VVTEHKKKNQSDTTAPLYAPVREIGVKNGQLKLNNPAVEFRADFVRKVVAWHSSCNSWFAYETHASIYRALSSSSRVCQSTRRRRIHQPPARRTSD